MSYLTGRGVYDSYIHTCLGVSVNIPTVFVVMPRRPHYQNCRDIDRYTSESVVVTLTYINIIVLYEWLNKAVIHRNGMTLLFNVQCQAELSDIIYRYMYTCMYAILIDYVTVIAWRFAYSMPKPSMRTFTE